MCYTVGFGTCRSLSSAAKFLRVAEELNHTAAKLFGPQLRSAITSDHPPSNTCYTSQVVHGLELPRPHETITLTFQPPANDDLPSYEASQENTQDKSSYAKTPLGSVAKSAKDTTPVLVFQTYEELKLWLNSPAAADRAHCGQLETAILTSTSSRMSILECAMLFHDLETVELLLEKHPKVLTRQLLPDPLFVTAFRTTNVHLVEALLRSSLDPFATDENRDTLFHWLFMLGENCWYHRCDCMQSRGWVNSL
jgi:hypothetical protein